MIETTVAIATRDGQMSTWIVHPGEPGSFPLVIFWMDALGVREELRDMCRRIASVGYTVYMANLFYRDGGPVLIQHFWPVVVKILRWWNLTTLCLRR